MTQPYLESAAAPIDPIHAMSAATLSASSPYRIALMYLEKGLGCRAGIASEAVLESSRVGRGRSLPSR